MCSHLRRELDKQLSIFIHPPFFSTPNFLSLRLQAGKDGRPLSTALQRDDSARVWNTHLDEHFSKVNMGTAAVRRRASGRAARGGRTKAPCLVCCKPGVVRRDAGGRRRERGPPAASAACGRRRQPRPLLGPCRPPVGPGRKGEAALFCSSR